MKKNDLVFFIYTIVILLAHGDTPKRTIAIIPLGPFENSLIDSMRSAVEAQFSSVKVDVLPRVALPAMAWYEPRKRYRAEKLLVFLDSIGEKKCSKIIGITATDISTTKGDCVDWGIFGYGAISDRPCVVSTFRLNKPGTTRSQLIRRLQRITIHELGHTFGLDHCTSQGCIMQDAAGKIATIDNSDGKFCKACSNFLEISF